jgi:hypothetical protein
MSTTGDDNCEVTSRLTCDESGIGEGWTSEVTLSGTWPVAGTKLTGITQIAVKNEQGEIECRSTYDVEITKR